jgi:MFS family permease
MTRAHGWTREVFAFAIALQNLVWGVAQPVAGRLADRLGTGKVVLAGSLLYAAGLALMSQAQSATMLALSAGLLVGLGLAGTSSALVFGAVARAVSPARRTVAMGILMAVAGLGQFVMPPVAVRAAGAVGWPGTLVALAWLGGRVYAHTSSYDLAWWACIALAIGAALLNSFVDEAPLDSRATAAGPPEAA